MKKPKPNCEECDGTGLVSMDDSMEGYSFDDFECDCVKEQSEQNEQEETY